MKQITLRNLLIFVLLTFTSLMFAQASHTVDFEPAGVGSEWDWTVEENGDNPAIEFIANPNSSGANQTPTVAKFIARSDGNAWALFYTDDNGTFTFDANNSTVSLMIHKPVISNIGLKFEGMSGAIELQVPNTVVNQWEEITFDFSDQIGNTYNRIVLIPDFAAREEDNLVYLDNIVLPEGEVLPPPAEPTDAPALPTQDAENVISIYSDSYDNVPNSNYNPGWGQSTMVTVNEMIAGNNTLKYANLNYQGTEFTSQNVSEYDYLHVDFWTPNSTTLDFYLISPSAEASYALDITHETWVSIDIPLSAYSSVVNLADVIQFKVVGNGTVWFDNYYFWKEVGGAQVATLSDLQVDGVTIEGFNSQTFSYDVVLPEGTTDIPMITATTTDPGASYVVNDATELPGTTTVVVTSADASMNETYTINFTINQPITEPTTAPEIPMHNADNVISIYSDTYNNVPNSNYNPDWGQSTVVTVNEMIAGNNTLKYANLNYQGTEFTSQDLSEYEYLHVDFWTPNSTDLNIYLISTGAESPYEFNIQLEEWVSVDIPLTAFSDLVDLSGVFQFKVVGNGTIWFDNLYFWKTSGGEESLATLSDLMVDGTSIEAFASDMFNYDVMLPEGTTDVPMVTATTSNPNASYMVMDASELPGTTEVEVTSEDETVMLSYYIHFTVEDPSQIPSEAAPTPTEDAEDVTSIFSDVYPNINVDTWSAEWDNADYEEVMIAENATKLYTDLVFAGIEFTSETIDASGMNYFHMDIWTPDATDQAEFRIKLVDFGADGVWGNDDTEHELTFDGTSLATGEWVSFDIPLTEFANMTGQSHIAQLIFGGDPNTLYVDNIYFYDGGVANASDDVDLASSVIMGNNYPNPFNPETTINYTLKRAGNVSLKIYNSKGQLVESLVNGQRDANNYNVVWKANNISSGIYFYQLKVDNELIGTKKMVLMK